MSDRLNNNLIRFIKRMLKSSDPQPWNTPPDSVFDNALIEIAARNQGLKRKKNRRALAVLITAGILGMAFLLQFEFHQLNRKIENLEGMITSENSDNIDSETLPATDISTVEIIPSSQSQLVRQTSDREHKTGAEHNAVVEHNTVVEHSTGVEHHTDIENKSQFENLEIEKSGAKTAHPDEIFRPIESQFNVLESSGPEGAINPHNSHALNETQELRETYRFQRLDTRSVLMADPDPSLTAMPSPAAPRILGSRKFAVGVSLGADFSTLVMKGDGGASILTEYDKYYCGFSVDGVAEYKLSNRWSAVFMVSYHKLKSQSRSRLNIAYDSSNETFDNSGNAMYSALGNIETPLGDHGTVFQFYTTSLTAQDGDMITYMTDIDQSLNVLSASLGGRYTPVQLRKIDLFVGFGADFSHELNSSNRMLTEMYMEDKFLGEFEEQPLELSKHAFNYFSLYGEVGARFIVGERTDFVAILRYTRSLSSLRTTGTNEPRTYVSQISPSIGINYYLQ